MERVAYAEYPIYSIATDGRFLATSGGGGGTKYGIEDQLEVFSVDEKTGGLTSVVSSAEAGGVVDSLCYNSNVDMWCGCCNDEILLLKRTEDAGFSIVLRVKTVPPEEAANKKKERLIVTRFSPSGELIVAGGERSVVSVWRVGQLPAAANTFQSPPRTATAEAASPPSEKASAETAASSPDGGVASSSSSSSSAAAAAAARTPPCAAASPAGEGKWEATLMCELRGHVGDIKDCCISCDSNLVASCATDGELRLWDWKTQQLLHVFSKGSQPQQQKRQQSVLFRCCRFLPAPVGIVEKSGMQRLLAVASSSPRGPSYFVGWSITCGTELAANSAAASNKKNDDTVAQPPSAAPSPPPAVAAAGDAADAAAASAVTVKQLCESMCEDGVPCSQAAVSEDGMLLALGFADGKCRVFDRRLRVVAQHHRHELPVTGLAFLRSHFLVSTSADYSIVVLDLTKRKRSSFELMRGRTCVFFFFLLLLLLLCGVAVHHAATTGYLHFIDKNEAVAIGAARDQILHHQIETRLRQRWEQELQDSQGLQEQYDVEMQHQQQQHQAAQNKQRQQQQQEELDMHRQHWPLEDLQPEPADPSAEAEAEVEPPRRSSRDTPHSASAAWSHEKDEL